MTDTIYFAPFSHLNPPEVNKELWIIFIVTYCLVIIVLYLQYRFRQAIERDYFRYYHGLNAKGDAETLKELNPRDGIRT